MIDNQGEGIINTSERLNLNIKDQRKENNKSNNKKGGQDLIYKEESTERPIIDIYKRNIIENNNQNNNEKEEDLKVDIPALIKGINNYNNCLNLYLENYLSNRNVINIYWKLFNSNDTIELFYDEESKNEFELYCKWCKDNCQRNLKFKIIKKEIVSIILNKNFKICNCKKKHKEENPLIRQKTNEFMNLKNEIDKKKFIKKLFLGQEIIEDSDNIDSNQKKEYNILFNNFIFLSVINKKIEMFTNFIELNFKYDDNLFKNIFWHFNKLNNSDPKIDLMYNFCEFYFQKYFLKNLKDNEISLLDLIGDNLNPDNYSFSFVINKKNRITKTSMEDKHVKLLNECGISNEQFYKITFLNKEIYYELISYGLYSNQILMDLYKERKITRESNPKFINQLYMTEIFNDFILKGKTDYKSIFDKENLLSKINLRRLLLRFFRKDFKNKTQIFIGLLDYFYFKHMYLENNKERLLIFLSSYSYSKNKKYLENENLDLKKEIKEIMNKNVEKNRNQNSYLIIKLYEYFKIDICDRDIENIKNHYNFSDLIDKVINLNILEKMVNECLEENFKIKKFNDILKVMTLCCINDIGIEYLYNSCILDKILRIIISIIKSPKKYENEDIDNDVTKNTITILIDDNNETEQNLKEIFIEFIIILSLRFNNEELMYKLNGLNFDSFEKNKYYYILKLLFFEQNIKNIFDGDNYLFFRLNLVFHILEKNNHNFLINCFSETKIEDSYSNIVKEILLNLDIDNKINNIFDKDKKYAEMSENDFKKKYLDNYLYTNEKIKNKKRFKGYYLLLVLQTLKNLDINFFFRIF